MWYCLTTCLKWYLLYLFIVKIIVSFHIIIFGSYIETVLFSVAFHQWFAIHWWFLPKLNIPTIIIKWWFFYLYYAYTFISFASIIEPILIRLLYYHSNDIVIVKATTDFCLLNLMDKSVLILFGVLVAFNKVYNYLFTLLFLVFLWETKRMTPLSVSFPGSSASKPLKVEKSQSLGLLTSTIIQCMAVWFL